MSKRNRQVGNERRMIMMNSTYNIVLETEKSTIVTEYKKQKRTETSYQSEALLKKSLLNY